MGVMSQPIDIEQPERVGHGLSSMSHARRSSSRRCRAGLATPVTEKTATFQVRSSGYDRAGFVGLPEKVLTWDATRRLRFYVHIAGWLHSMVFQGCRRSIK